MYAIIKKSWIYLGLLAIIALLGVGLIKEALQYQHLQAQMKTSMQAEILKSSVQNMSLTDQTGKNPYSNWLNTEKLANGFYSKSHGRFKKSWGIFLIQQSRKHGIDPNIVFQLLSVESGRTFNPKQIGPKTKYGRAYGMSQFMSNTAPWIAKMAGMPYQKSKLFDPYYSIELSITYLDFLHNRYGNWNQTLTAYNRGMYGMKQYIQKHGNSKSEYATKIEQLAQKTKRASFNR